MNINNLINREKEIIGELNRGDTNHMQELLGISYTLSTMYEPCKCGFVSKHKETGICKECDKQ